MNTRIQTNASQATHPLENLMDVYEQNYILMRRLFGDFRQFKTGDECPWDANVSTKISGRSKFTLDVHFIDQRVMGAKRRPLSLRVRVYHDARTAELLETAHRDHCLQDQVSRCTAHQLKLNKMLNNWLSKHILSMSEK